MNLDQSLLVFANLYEMSGLSADRYARQDELVDWCRANRRPFLAVMPVRHMFQCSSCGLQQSEATMHFEDPRLPSIGATSETRWPSESGVFVTSRSVLHAAIAHGEAIPAEASAFFEAVV
jgi:hypothetical protein